MSAADHHEGHCLCGAVTVKVDGPLGDISACHCEMCTRWSGSVQMGAEVDRNRVAIAGPVATYQSSEFAERAWCNTCGSAVWFKDTIGENEHVFELAPGLFDGFGGARLVRVVYCDRAAGGVRLAGDLDRMTKAEYEAQFPFVEDSA